MSEHESIRRLLALAAAGVLSSRDQSRVELHLRNCDGCRRELDAWRVYADGLQRLPQPVVSVHLIERTQALIAQKELGTTEHRHSATVLVGLAVFGWIFSFALWLLLRLSTAGSLFILHTNILRPDLWALGWTLSVWASGATAAVMLARRQREWRRVL